MVRQIIGVILMVIAAIKERAPDMVRQIIGVVLMVIAAMRRSIQSSNRCIIPLPRRGHTARFGTT